MNPTYPLSVTEAAERRRSIRRYTAQPVEMETIEEILRVAGRAPSAWNLQPWRVVVVRDPEAKSRLQEAAFGQAQVGSAPAVFVVASDMQDVLGHLEETIHPGLQGERRERELETIRRSFAKMDPAAQASWGRNQTYIFLGYLLLAISSHGLSSSPMLGFDPAKVRALFGMGDHVEIPALVAFGYGDEEGFSTHRHPVARVAQFVG